MTVETSSRSEDIGKLVKAVADCSGAVGVVKNTGRNDFHRYSFASDADIASAVVPQMARYGLVLLLTDVRQLGPAGELGRVYIEAVFTLAHSSGEWMEVRSLGAGVDVSKGGVVGDKAPLKALTAARKYALRLCFGIASSDDPEVYEAPSKPEHDDSFGDKARKAFGAALDELEPKLKYDEVASYCEANGTRRPSALTAVGRDNLLKALRDGGAAKVYDFHRQARDDDEDWAGR